MEKFKTVLDLYTKHHSTLGYGLITLLTAGGERLFSAVVFQCPCIANWNLAYGLVFLLVPALVLLLLGYLLSTRTWRLLTGCCVSHKRCTSGLSCALLCTQLSAGATVAPLTWMAMALLGGSFYECAASEIPGVVLHLCKNDSECKQELLQVPCSQAKDSDMQSHLKVLKAQSQVFGWIMIAVIISVFVIFTSINRCLSPVSFLQLKFWKIYLEQEQRTLKSEATEHATALAKENVRCFFEGSHPEKCSTPSIKDWQQISSLYMFNPKEQYYSMLHKYVNRGEGRQSIASSEGDAVIPVLGFVDASAIHTTNNL
ncbi:calcium homeostasis modulator protein 6 [Ochotona princeps]|uniref:calcium homeostasis modulator protein 6 n=1 Tax=Ochotona princeps TaxID=9978 RepID=UPI0027152C6A|nr:calcium homeostasis modulator protein 6 [Ochotona princeps]